MPDPNPDNDNGAFTPAADPLNDIRIVFSILDLPAGGFLAENDSGEVCVQSLQVDRIPLTSFVIDETLYSAPIDEMTHEIISLPEMTSGMIDDGLNLARMQLQPALPVDRGTLIPQVEAAGPDFVDIDGDEVGDALNALKFHPVVYEPDAIYRLRSKIYKLAPEELAAPFARGGVGDDPVDVMTLIVDVATNELGQTDFATRAAPGGVMDRAASPKLLDATGGAAPEYMSFFHSNGGTLADPEAFPNANRLRPQLDFFNRADLGSIGIGPSGGDPFVIETMVIDRVRITDLDLID